MTSGPGLAGAARLSGLVVLLAGPSLAAARPAELAPNAEAAPPAALAGAVCRPQFAVDARSHTAGTAFLLQAPGPQPHLLLVTAHHVLGTSGEPGGAIPWADAPARVHAARCTTLDRKRTWTTGPALAVEGAHPLGELALLRDIAVLPVVGETGAAGETAPLKLANADPAPGEAVWLLAELDDPARTGEVLHRARVVDAWGHLAFAYDDKHPRLHETSGAPIVNARGEVVGVNVGFSVTPGVEGVVGVADDLATLRAALAGPGTP